MTEGEHIQGLCLRSSPKDPRLRSDVFALLSLRPCPEEADGLSVHFYWVWISPGLHKGPIVKFAAPFFTLWFAPCSDSGEMSG